MIAVQLHDLEVTAGRAVFYPDDVGMLRQPLDQLEREGHPIEARTIIEEQRDGGTVRQCREIAIQTFIRQQLLEIRRALHQCKIDAPRGHSSKELLGVALGLVHDTGYHDLPSAPALHDRIDDSLLLIFTEALVLPVGAEDQVAPKRRLPVEGQVVSQGLNIEVFVVCKRRGYRGEDALELLPVACIHWTSRLRLPD